MSPRAPHALSLMENGHNYPAADGAIVGTSIKRDGNVDEPVDRDRAARLVESFKR